MKMLEEEKTEGRSKKNSNEKHFHNDDRIRDRGDMEEV
jgi:hypothetical protein